MPEKAIEIRDALPNDLDAIFAIYNHEVLHEISTFDTEPRDTLRDGDWLSRRESRYPVLVADCGGEIAGWGSLSQW